MISHAVKIYPKNGTPRSFVRNWVRPKIRKIPAPILFSIPKIVPPSHIRDVPTKIVAWLMFCELQLASKKEQFFRPVYPCAASNELKSWNGAVNVDSGPPMY